MRRQDTAGKANDLGRKRGKRSVTNKQARLVAAIADAMEIQSFSQNGLAKASGVAQSMISAAMLGKYDLKEEKWRLLCETLALDYDDIIADQDIHMDVTDNQTPVEEAKKTKEGIPWKKGQRRQS